MSIKKNKMYILIIVIITLSAGINLTKFLVQEWVEYSSNKQEAKARLEDYELITKMAGKIVSSHKTIMSISVDLHRDSDVTSQDIELIKQDLEQVKQNCKSHILLVDQEIKRTNGRERAEQLYVLKGVMDKYMNSVGDFHSWLDIDITASLMILQEVHNDYGKIMMVLDKIQKLDLELHDMAASK